MAGPCAVRRKAGRAATQPFTPENASIELTAKARNFPAWRADRQNLVGLLQPSPANTVEPEETITLIPMGAARLDISAFPTAVPDGGHVWAAPSP